MITSIYKNINTESDELCVNICEVLYNILNQIYNFNRVININKIKDIHKISNKTAIREAIYINIAEYRGSARTVLRRLNMEAFVNINTTLITVIPTSLLKFVKENTVNVDVEYIPSTLVCDDVEIEVEDNLAVVIFNPNNDNRGDICEH